MSTVEFNRGMVVVLPRQTRASKLRAKKYSGLSSTASQPTINIAFGSALSNKDRFGRPIETPRSLQIGTPRRQTIPRQRSAIPVSTLNHSKELEKNRETDADQLRKMNEMSMRIRELQRLLHAEETKNRESLATIKTLDAQNHSKELEKNRETDADQLRKMNEMSMRIRELQRLLHAEETKNRESLATIKTLEAQDAENEAQSYLSILSNELLRKHRQVLMLQHNLRLAEINQTPSDQQLLTKLEQKDQMISKLENIVRSQEELQKRSNFQRLRQKEKISSLEHELHDTRSGRSLRPIQIVRPFQRTQNEVHEV